MVRLADAAASGSSDTIFALSSGPPPAGIAVVRVSGPQAHEALVSVAGALPVPRHASLRALYGQDGKLLDRALILWFPGPATATGEDLAELHLHGGRAVVAAVLATLGSLAGLRPAHAGEYTRRALLAGRLDLAEAEGLADLLQAETEGQRRRALRLVEGGMGRLVDGWRVRLLDVAARCEAAISYGEELDEDAFDGGSRDDHHLMAAELRERLNQPPAERLRDGLRIVIAGRVNAGKSSLLNALAARDAAIASPHAGTTRDLIEAPVVFGGTSYLLIDGAGLRHAQDEVEQIGIERVRAAIAQADIVLWLGGPAEAPERAIVVRAKADQPAHADDQYDIAVSIYDPPSIARLWAAISARGAILVRDSEEPVLNLRQRHHCIEAVEVIEQAAKEPDILLVAEHLRAALAAFDAITGREGPEAVLDTLFARFCVGK